MQTKAKFFLTNTSVYLRTPTHPNRERDNHLSHGFIKHVNHDWNEVYDNVEDIQESALTCFILKNVQQI